MTPPADVDPGTFEPPDPLESAVDVEHNGTALLREGRELLASKQHEEAAGKFEAALAAGLPTELIPHYYVLHGAACLHAGDFARATQLLQDGWRAHPDFSALPALLGLAQFSTGDHAQAARSMYAALLGDDPDGSLATYRRTLTASLQVVLPQGGGTNPSPA